MLWVLKWLTILAVVSAVAIGVFAVATSGGNNDGGAKRVELDLTAIRQLSTSAAQDADNMQRHADTMTSIAATQPNQAQWASEAELARANARSLRFIAESARAIDNDQRAFPVTANAVQLDRLLGDGQNLQNFGQSIVDHASAMDSHIAVMRQQAGGDSSLLATITSLAQDVQQMKDDGTSAVSAGKALTDKARTIAASVGVKID